MKPGFRKIVFILRRYVLPTVTGLLFLYLLWRSVDVAESLRTFSGVRIGTACAAAGIYIVQYFFLAVRWRLLNRGRVGIGSCYAITAVHNMTNNVLPFRTGELAYPYLLKRHFNIGLGDSTATLFYARIFDLVAMVLFFIGSLAFVGRDVLQTIAESKGEILQFTLLVVLIGGVLLGMYVLLDRWANNQDTEKHEGLRGKVRGAFRSLTEGLARVEIVSISVKMFVSSLAIFLARYAFFMYALRAFGIDLVFGESVAASTLAILGAIFPLQGVGGYGTVETGWVLGLVLIGVEAPTALMAGFGVHTFRLVLSVLLAGSTYPILAHDGRKHRGADGPTETPVSQPAP
ncbi:MAG: flippase-like domain-containing protein [Deltaproteobacteria bacterium]|nr:flippase-like domain-containing protein [Candidatus Zymogenaceae bacterium]